MRIYNNETLLEMVELYAAEVGAIASEEELSERFDREVAPAVIKLYGEDDGPAMSETFNDWTDTLCEEGEIHPVQYSDYCYVGRYS